MKLTFVNLLVYYIWLNVDYVYICSKILLQMKSIIVSVYFGSRSDLPSRKPVFQREIEVSEDVVFNYSLVESALRLLFNAKPCIIQFSAKI